jgi:hypothetical protein
VRWRHCRNRRSTLLAESFVRTGTLEDVVGVLKPQARFQLDEPAQQHTVAISVLDSPVELLAQAHFSIRVSDLASCHTVAVEK